MNKFPDFSIEDIVVAIAQYEAMPKTPEMNNQIEALKSELDERTKPQKFEGDPKFLKG